ncbi:MAG TPA: hypothetical protein VM778_07705 [Gemmatimonadota bacterium]|nr:hypothetical protein [Gemmatimonadota bacterium]
MRTWIAIALVGLTGVWACDDGNDDLTLEGTYVLTIAELEDTCDNDQNQYEATMTITRLDNDLWRIDFGDEATLNGTLDADGILQAAGQATVTVLVAGAPVEVAADMVMQTGLRLTGEIEASGILTFEGTFPGVEEVCFQEFVAEGQRQNRVPTLLMGPGAR